MLALLIFLGIAIPAAELFLLILVSQWIGFWPTIGLIVVTGVTGALLWRWQGFGVFGRFRSAMTEGVMQDQMGASGDSEKPKSSPLDVLLDGAMIFFAGGLLLTPGILTDVLGLLLLFPFTRYLFKLWVYRWGEKRFKVVDFTSTFKFDGLPPDHPFANHPYSDAPEDEDIIEGEIISRSDENSRGIGQKDSEG